MKEKLWNANYIKVMTTNFLLYFAFYLLTPLLPLYLSENFGATKDVIGIVLSGYTVAALIIRPFSGYVVDSFSRKKVLMVCLSAFAIFFAGYIAASTILMFAICRTLHGGPFGAVTVANSTCAIDVLPASRRNEGIGLYGLSNNFAMAIAPSIGIYLHNAVDSYMILFWIAFIVAIASVVIAGTIRLPEKEIVKNKEKLSLDRFFLTRAWLLAINIAMFGFCWGVLSNYLAIYSKEELGITGGTSAGAINYTPVAKVTNIANTIEALKKEGLWFVCADMGGETMYNLDLKGPIGLVIGNEGNGVSRLVKEKCDFVASIPMKGDIDSLNASVAAGVMAFEIVRQRMV